MKPNIFIFIFIFICSHLSAQQSIGYWGSDQKELPVFRYTGKIPYNYTNDQGQKIDLPDDPWFLIGNYKITAFVHTSGIYEMFCFERAWGKLNNKNTSNAFIVIDNKKIDLTGLDSKYACDATKEFGTGYAKFVYKLPENVKIIRTISTEPSEKINSGLASLFFNIQIVNEGNKSINIEYSEQIGTKYNQITQKPWINFNTTGETPQTGISKINFSPISKYSLFPNKDEASIIDMYPPFLYQYTNQQCQIIQNISNSPEDCSVLTFKRTINSKKSETLNLTAGWSFDSNFNQAISSTNDLFDKYSKDLTFRDKWYKLLPNFKNEKKIITKREMIWNAYTLLAMAKYNSYFDETFVPQGMHYDYLWGLTAATRDLLFSSLPVAYYNPMLAKSIIKMVSKTMLPSGTFNYTVMGYGYTSNNSFNPSDFQFDYIMAITNYIKATSDYSILTDVTSYYPKGYGEADVITKIEKAFIFVRDEIGVGANGMIKVLNADWNDQVWANYSMSAYYWQAESPFNSALALYSLAELQNIISNLPPSFSKNDKLRLEKLSSNIQIFRSEQLQAFLKNLGNRVFPRRVIYSDTLAWGEKFMFCESVGMTLLIPELDIERKKKLVSESEKKLLNGEVLGPRLSDNPIEEKVFAKGTRENAGIWHILSAFMALGYAQVDTAKAMNILNMMSFNNFAKNYPNYWAGQWTNLDFTNSSLAILPGLPDKPNGIWNKFPAYCSNVHSLPLYVYFKIKKQ